MPDHTRSRWDLLLLRWLFGTALVSWRYMWQTTPLYRRECAGDLATDAAPELPTELADDRVHAADDGVGLLYHRRFRVNIACPTSTAEGLMAAVLADFKRFVPSEVVGVQPTSTSEGRLSVGDEIVVEMPGPWDGPVRVVHVDHSCLRFATMEGHLEAGQVQFRAYDDGDLLVFEVEAWARPSTPVVHLLYARLRLAKEIQLNMWVRFCLAAAAAAGGRLTDGVQIDTRWVDVTTS
ncbi:MAG TPA: DUF1990 family protein [Nocardioidaceae bacterium]|nr:DUF1990 family protein [Nocardioidaceae bacterium]